MNWKVVFSNNAAKQLSKMDSFTRKTIINWIKKNLLNCTNPRAYGTAFTGTKKDYWRYRVGSYRITADIKDNVITIEIISIGHRSIIYKQ